MRVEQSSQTFDKSFLEGDQMHAHSVVGHRVYLGLKAGAGQRLVDVLLQVVQTLLHGSQVRARHQGGHLIGNFGMPAHHG